jgi:curli biogenesis system outer membrane secretion channel CsgG
MKRVCAIALMTLISTVVCNAQKKRVAVMDFDYATVHSGVSAIFGSNVDVGKGITDMLVDRLVRSGVYSVIERQALDKILAEQNFSNSDRADPASAAKIAKILGVDAIIIGSITQFGRDDESTGVGGFGRVAGRFGLGGVRRSEAKAVVAVNARMINTSTAEILAVASGKGESERTSTSLLGAGGGGGAAGGGGIDMRSSNFGATILGEATNAAVEQLATELDQQAERLPTVERVIEGLVADATGGILILNVGSNAGIQVGDKLQVTRKVREIKDPATGRVLRSIEDPVGQVTISEVDELSSVGSFSGSGTPQVGDLVKNQ